jgi:hypothetical protein
MTAVALGYCMLAGLQSWCGKNFMYVSASENLHSFLFFEAGSPYVAQAGLELGIFLPWPPSASDYKCAPPHLSVLVFLMSKS